jgi:putative large structural protein
MKTFLELFLRASRALPFLLLLLAFYDQSLRAQVPLPDVKFQDYRSQDVSPLLSEASNAATQSAYESIVDEKIRQVSQTWQQDAYQKIQTALLSINDSDTFNDVNAYRAHVEALLVAQKEEAWNGYWAALQNEVAQNRQTFAAALASKTLVSTQEGQTADAKSALSISSNPANAWDTARSALDASHAKWQKEYLAKLEGGMQDYEAALRGITDAEANYNQGIAQTDTEFRARLAEIQAAENRVRAGVSSQVDGMEASLASSDFFYEENCDAQTNACTADRSKPTAAALELRSLIDSMRKNIADGAPLSQLGHQMRDYLAAQKASADQHVQHWQSLSQGQLPFSMSANQAPRSAEEWAAWAGRPYAGSSTCSGEGGVCAGVAMAMGLMSLTDKFDGTYARGEAGYMLSQSDFKSFADFAANGSNADGVKAYISAHGENRQVTDVVSADIVGLTTNQSYKQLGIQALTVARAPDPMLCVWMGMGNPLLAIGCALLLKDQSPETAFSLTATYKWQDNNAISNASVWSGYSSELAMGQESWDNMLLPALDTWETNTAAYKAKYKQWKIDSAAEAPQMTKKFADARSALLADERSYVNQMDQLWTNSKHIRTESWVNSQTGSAAWQRRAKWK